MPRITWYGHAAFLIDWGASSRWITDPYRYPDAGGYLPIEDPADYVIVSHENDRYHSHLGQIAPPFAVIRALELPTVPAKTVWGDVTLEVLRVFENPQKLPEDEVTVFQLSRGDFRLLFLGDLGHALTDEECAPFCGADVVLIPAGGPPTLDFPLMPGLLAQLRPRFVIPMHYKTPKINLNIQPVERFLAVFPDWPVRTVGGATLEPDGVWNVAANADANAASPSAGAPTILLMEHAR